MDKINQYFDAVVDWQTNPIYNGTPEQTRMWLDQHPEVHENHEVAIGETLEIVPVSEYLSRS